MSLALLSVFVPNSQMLVLKVFFLPLLDQTINHEPNEQSQQAIEMEFNYLGFLFPNGPEII